MQRLFSSFAHGAPGIGLLLMRLGAGGSLIAQAAGVWPAGAPTLTGGFGLLSLGTAVLLLLGLWTPVAGLLATGLSIWHAVAMSITLSPFADLLLGVLGFALALVGPGAWSVDARLFGWRRFEIQTGDSRPDSDAPREDAKPAPPVE